MSEPVIQAVLSQLRGRRYRLSLGLSYVVGRRDTPGLYALWVGCCCLYVGMSEHIGQRFRQHLARQHNRRLETYLEGFWGNIEVTVAPVMDRARLKSLEDEAILALRPRANIAIPKAG